MDTTLCDNSNSTFDEVKPFLFWVKDKSKEKNSKTRPIHAARLVLCSQPTELVANHIIHPYPVVCIPKPVSSKLSWDVCLLEQDNVVFRWSDESIKRNTWNTPKGVLTLFNISLVREKQNTRQSHPSSYCLRFRTAHGQVCSGCFTVFSKKRKREPQQQLEQQAEAEFSLLIQSLGGECKEQDSDRTLGNLEWCYRTSSGSFDARSIHQGHHPKGFVKQTYLNPLPYICAPVGTLETVKLEVEQDGKSIVDFTSQCTFEEYDKHNYYAFPNIKINVTGYIQLVFKLIAKEMPVQPVTIKSLPILGVSHSKQKENIDVSLQTNTNDALQTMFPVYQNNQQYLLVFLDGNMKACLQEDHGGLITPADKSDSTSVLMESDQTASAVNMETAPTDFYQIFGISETDTDSIGHFPFFYPVPSPSPKRNTESAEGIHIVPPAAWSVDEVCSWLTRNGWENYVEAFQREKIDGEALDCIKEEDLKEIGVTMGDRKKMIKRFASLTQE